MDNLSFLFLTQTAVVAAIIPKMVTIPNNVSMTAVIVTLSVFVFSVSVNECAQLPSNFILTIHFK